MKQAEAESHDQRRSHQMLALFRSPTSRGVPRQTLARWLSGVYETKMAPGVAPILVVPPDLRLTEAAIFGNITSDTPSLCSAVTKDALKLLKADSPVRKTALAMRLSTTRRLFANGKAATDSSAESIIW
jgi:hypothetical protein